LRLDIGTLMPTSNVYKPGVLGSIREIKNKRNYEEFEIQSHFYAGKPLRKGTLRANSGSYAQLFSVPSVVLYS
jgi:hypothetical protein